MIVDELIAILGYDVRGEADRRRFEAGLDNIRTKMRGFATAAVAAGAAAGAALAAGVGLAGRSMVQTSAQFEGFQVALETLEGSSAKAEKSMAWISEFAIKTPYDVAGITDAFIKLKAYGIDPIANDTMRILGDTASAMNRPLNMAVEALADAATFQFERLREFGITTQQQGDEVVFSWTKNGENVSEIVGKTGEDVRRFLLDNFGARFGGAMEKQSSTFTGIMSNIQEAWTTFQRKIGDAGAFDVIKGQLAGLLESFNRWEVDGTIDRWAQRFSDAYSWVFNATEAAVQHISQQIATLVKVFENPAIPTAAKALGAVLAVAFAWAFPVITTFVALGLAIDDLISYIGGGESVIGDFIAWLQRLGETISEGFDAEGFRQIGDNLAAMLFDGFTWAVARLFRNMTAPLRYIWSGLTGGDAESGANETAETLGGLLLRNLVAVANRLFNNATFLPRLIFSTLTGTDARGSSETAASSIVTWFFRSMDAAWATFEGLVNGLVDDVVAWFVDTDWRDVGVQIVTAIFNGMKSLGASIRSYVAGLMPEMPSWLGGGVEAPATQRGGNSHAEGARMTATRGSAARAREARDRTSGATEYAESAAHARSLMGQGAVASTVNDQRNQSSRMENHITIHQTVTQAADAPATAATATSRAVGESLKSQARVQAEGAR